MMGRQSREQEQLFYSFCLDEAVPETEVSSFAQTSQCKSCNHQ